MCTSETSLQKDFWLTKGKNYSIVCPNYTPVCWSECDLFCLTKSKFFHEYEIKMTRHDFNKDKKKIVQIWENGVKQKQKKYKMLDDGNTYGPAQFSYVVPEGLLEPKDTPSFSGLFYWLSNGRIKTVVSPPRLHNEKIDDKVVEHVRGVFYHRYWNEKSK